MLKMLLFSSIFNIQKFTSLASFKKIHAAMTAATIQSNKIVLNEVKDN